jgi:arsenate reductase (thioredoxin)
VTTRSRRADLSIDQDLALRTAAVRLSDRFGALFGVETIERFLHASYDEFASRAAVPNHLPLLAERFARQRLDAPATVEGRAGTGLPTVLWAAATRARCSPAAATRSGGCPIPPVSTWRPSGRSATRSSAASVCCSPSWA